MLIVARHGTSVRPEVINMPRKHDVHAPSRGRRTKKVPQPAGEIPGQLSIDDVLAEIAAEQAADQAAEGGEQS